MEAWKKFQAQNEQTATVVAEACRIVPKLHIPQEVSVETKISKLATVVRDTKMEVAMVQFELNLKITKLQLKLQPSTPLEVREQCKAPVKDGIVVVDATVVDCPMLFKQSMEVVTVLQEDPKLQRLNTKAREFQQWYDEARLTTCTIAISQRLAKLHEAKQLLEQVEAVQSKEAVLKARLGPWMDEAYVLSTTIEEKLESLLRMKQKIQEDSVGPTTEQLVEQIKQAATQSTTKVAMAQVELGGLHCNISLPAE